MTIAYTNAHLFKKQEIEKKFSKVLKSFKELRHP